MAPIYFPDDCNSEKAIFETLPNNNGWVCGVILGVYHAEFRW